MLEAAHYLFDAEGKLRHTHFGEGAYEETEQIIQELLSEKGEEVKEEIVPIKMPVDFTKIGSAETYLGYNRMVGFASPEDLIPDTPQNYSIPPEIKKNRVYFGGNWKIELEKSVLESSTGRIVYRYTANKLNLVMGANKPIKARVIVDGSNLELGNKGDDIDDKGFVNIQEYKLYNLNFNISNFTIHFILH